MIVDLSTSLPDSSAEDLGLYLDGPRQAGLASHQIDVPHCGLSVEFIIHASSHQVVVTGLGSSLVETVGVGADSDGEPLPDQRSTISTPFRHEVTTETAHYQPQAFVNQCQRLIHLFGTEIDRSLVGRYQSSEQGTEPAITALALSPASGPSSADDGTHTTSDASGSTQPVLARWESWHTYPATGQIVRTRTTLSAAG